MPAHWPPCRPLTDEEGGGFLIEYPDLPGCISNGETIAEAIENGEDAVRCWLIAAQAPLAPSSIIK